MLCRIMDQAKRERATEAEYLARERASDARHEYVNGEIVAMAGGSPAHAQLAYNLIAALGARLRAGPCRGYSSDLRVHVAATRLYTYPDLTVVCGEPRFHTEDGDTLINPTLIAEVLSDATEAYDRGAKFAHYQRLESLREYVLVSQNERRIEVFRRAEGGDWMYHEYRDAGLVALPALGIEVPLAEVYERVGV